ncbi:hypothetical protein Z046_26340 [Pseudomonas aeruginosa VRFPA09]|jgi:hypothetical protein|nr:hypothetical protein Z046_26340 [Pseudomonas aeruginosa VRFPA09]HEK1439189.1 transmembrane anchor protein [Pseudomonas aeruginosa]
MHNSMPTSADLPSSRQLLRSTIIALIAATVLLITVVLPAEYAIDPTGVGRVLGLTEMGEIKGQLAEEAAADAARDTALAAEQSALATAPATAAVTSPAQPVEDATWRDEMRVVLQPGQGAEVKLSMKTGEQAQFSWVAEGGVVNFDTHGDGGGQSISYEKGRAVPADDGVLEAAFDGNHGWFWRNRDSADVTVIIRTRGQYTEMKRVL